MIEKAKNIALGVILLIALVIPFLALFTAQNLTLLGWGLPVAGVTGLAIFMVIYFLFNLIKGK